jgi:hypothetical protein
MRASKQPARSRQALRRNTFRPRLELLEHRLAPAGFGLVEVGPAVTFDPGAGSLAIRGGADGAAVRVGTSGDGSVAVSINGQASFDPALAGLSAGALRQISLLGGPGDSLTLDGVSAAGHLAVQSDGGVTLAGDVGAAGRLTVSAASLDVQGTAHAASLLLNATGTLNVEATGSLIADNGGSITAAADYFVNAGQVRADGASGGLVSVTARDDLNAGTLSAAGTAGAGGQVQVAFTESYIDTVTATTTASGTAGGSVSVNGGSGGRLFSSGRFEAAGASGGSVDLFGQDILLIGAAVDASGTGGGGRVRVGGDFHGANAAVPNAQTVYVSPATSLRADGAAGQLVVWSEQSTAFGGAASALGGGLIEVSSRGQLTFGGTADPGPGGTLLLDPKFIVISAGTGGQFPQFNLVNPGTNGAFGTGITTLPSGNIVVTDPNVNTGKGAVYLFNGQTGALLSTLSGSSGAPFSFPDALGSGGVTVLPSGNYVIYSPTWGSGNRMGAVTWGSGTTGVSGILSAANSLVGSSSSDMVGSGGVTVLADGNYVVDSPAWSNNFGASPKGAVTWGSGTAGAKGAVSATNSLVGSAGDAVGSGGVRALTNGNYVVSSPAWSNNKGAATWASGAVGITGAISSANSLVGSNTGSSGDFVSSRGVTALANGNYVVSSPSWNATEGAVTWGGGAAGVVGIISSSNSLVGSTAGTSGDQVGSGGVTALTNGNYVVISPLWNNSEGAVTWESGATSAGGVVSSANSLVGTAGGSFGDKLGSGGVAALPNGNYVIDSPTWTFNTGAVTWANGTTGISGTVSASNSLVGTRSNTDGDYVGVGGFSNGHGGVVVLPGGNYVVLSPAWNRDTGAVTWGSGATGVSGAVSATNSVVGATAGGGFGGGDQVGSGGVTALSNGNYVVSSPAWGGGKAAVTWGSGTAAGSGVVSAANSLVGAAAGDAVGSGGVTALTNGNYVVSSPAWNNKVGAATWASGAGPTSATVSAANSLVGSTAGSSGDQVGSGGVAALHNGNYVVLSPLWNISKGAATWGGGTAGTVGTVSSSNSIVGTTGGSTGDQVGSGGVVALTDGNFVVSSPKWNTAAGAVTWEFGDTGTTIDGQGTFDAANSLLGASSNAGLVPVILGAVNGSFVAGFSTEGPGRVTVGYVNTGSGGSDQLAFGFQPTQTVTVTPTFLQHALAAGTNVILQANDDVTVSSPVTVTTAGTPGNLTLQAGRSVLLNAGIRTAGGNLTLIANDSVADGVVDAQRDPGKGYITEAGGITLDAGAGTLLADLEASTDTTNHAQGVVTLLGVAAGTVKLSTVSPLGVTINGSTPGDGTTAGTYTQTSATGAVNLNGAALAVTHKVLTTQGETFTIVHSTAGVSGTFAGLAENAIVTADDGTQFKINYGVNGGNDVVLTQVAKATHLVVSTQPPSSVTAGTGFGLAVTAEDDQGNVVTTYSGSVTLTLASSPSGGTLGGTLTVPVNQGVATFSGLTLDKVGSYTLQASSGTLAKATTNGINVMRGPTTQLVVTTQPPQPPATVVVATAFGLVVSAEDAQGNVDPTFTKSVTVALGSNPGGSTLGGTLTVSANQGVAAFTGLTLNTVGNGYTLQATAAGVTQAISNAFNVTHGPATQLLITQQPPSSVTAGGGFGLKVTAEDAQGNVDTGFTGNVAVALANNPGGPGTTLGGTLTVAASGGVAMFTGLTLTKAANGYTLQATSGTLTSATTNSFNVTAAPATKLVVTTQPPATVVVATAFGLVVSAEDSFNNVDPNFAANVSVALFTNPGGSTLGGTLMQPASSGVATFNDLTLNLPGNGYKIQANAGTLSLSPGITAAFNVMSIITAVKLSNGSVGSVLELRPVGTTVGTLSSTEAGPGHSFTYTLVSGAGSADNASFTISADKLVTADAFDFNAKSSYSVRVRSTDESGGFLEVPLTVTITDDPALNLSSRTLAVSGTATTNTFVFSPGTVRDSLTLNGVNLAVDVASVDAITFSGGGSDTVTLNAAGTGNIASLTPTGAMLRGSGYSVSVSGTSQVNVTGGSGDSAYFTDSPGADIFQATPAYATQSGPGYTDLASGFGYVHANSSGGSDRAYLYDTAGGAAFLGTPTYAYLAGAKFTNVVAGFPTVISIASAGADSAYLYGSPAGGSVLIGTPGYSYLYGTGFFNEAVSYARVVGTAGAASDLAYLYGSPAGGNVFVGTPNYGYLYGAGYFDDAVSFQKVTASAGTSSDNAYLYGAAGNIFVATSSNAYLYGAGYFNDASGFHSVYGYSGGGGAAYLLGTLTAADTFVSGPGYAYLYGDLFFQLASGFASVSANPNARR